MDTRQRVILLIGLALLIGAGLFPPYLYKLDVDAGRLAGIKNQRNEGMHFILNPPKNEPGSTSFWYYEIYYKKLFIHWGIIIAITAFAIIFAGFWKEKPPTPSVFAPDHCGHAQGPERNHTGTPYPLP